MLRPALVLLLTLLTLSPPPAHATVLRYLRGRQLVEQADVVARGQVVAQRVVTEGGRLWTDSTLRISRALKGKLRVGQTLVIRQPGGETATLGMHVAGVARFALHEDALIFAQSTGSVHVPVGMSQGKYQIYRDQQGRLRARRDLAGAALAEFDARGRMSLRSSLPRADRDVALEALLAQIRAELAAGGAR